MMYSDKLVVALKVGGRILREDKDTVTLPFGSEYSVFIKNLNSVRMQVAVTIDGEDVAGRLVIAPNSVLELERFMQSGNLSSGNRFKFIERSAAVEAHLGISAEDGLIRVEGWREVPQRLPFPFHSYEQRRYDRKYARGMLRSKSFAPTLGTTTQGWGEQAAFTCSLNNVASSAVAASAAPEPTSDQGITVPGSVSNQSFHYVENFPIETTSSVIVMRLRGAYGQQVVTEPVTVEQKLECSSCGLVSKSSSMYCARCGTSLRLVG